MFGWGTTYIYVVVSLALFVQDFVLNFFIVILLAYMEGKEQEEKN